MQRENSLELLMESCSCAERIHAEALERQELWQKNVLKRMKSRRKPKAEVDILNGLLKRDGVPAILGGALILEQEYTGTDTTRLYIRMGNFCPFCGKEYPKIDNANGRLTRILDASSIQLLIMGLSEALRARAEQEGYEQGEVDFSGD